MFFYLTKWKIIFVLFLIVASSAVVAKETQLYFLARQAPLGSIVNAGQGQQVVYLRWDQIEGRLPEDVVSFRLLRNGVAVNSTDFPANAVMSISEINTLYHGAAQQRRKLELITRLNELTAANGDAFSAANFASYLHGLLNPLDSENYNPLWAFLGSSTDFNIARARYRGWIDTLPATGTVEYELLAVNANDDTVRVGLTQVNLGAANTLPGASDFKQILTSDARCDYPENAKDHFTVALAWNSPGENVTPAVVADRIAAQLYISGYDLYRSSENLAADIIQAPIRDIAALAAQVSSDSRGIPQLTGLDKVNLSLLIDSGSTINGAKWLEARDLLKRAGLKPGDRRAYYLVAKDFTGNYGPTVATIVTVPSTTRPPAPWNLRVFADETSSVLNPPFSQLTAPDALLFSWDKVNLANYMRMFQGTRKYCNALAAQTSGVLEFVGINQNCATDLHSSVRLDVEEYRVYRFTDFDVAGRFKDSDGDGVADSDERQLGLQCDATQQPIGAINYLAQDVSLTNIDAGFLSGNPDIVRLRDKVPAGAKDTVYWYRIVSVAGNSSSNQRVSFLSAPQRGLFPNRTPPDEPIVEIKKMGKTRNGCELISSPNAEWRFDEKLSPLGEVAAPLTLTCTNNVSYTFIESDVSSTTLSQCNDIRIDPDCGSKSTIVTLSYPMSPATGGVACEVVVPSDVSFCANGRLSLVPTYQFGNVDVRSGDLVNNTVEVKVRPPNSSTCVALFENIDGSAVRIASSCEPEGITYLPGNGSFCGYAIATDENNNISTAVHFPCTLATKNLKAPGSPQILNFKVNDAEADITFRVSDEQAVITMIRLDHNKSDGSMSRTVDSVSVIASSTGENIVHVLSVDALLTTKDRFCVSLKAIARNSGDVQSLSSPWSKQRCYTRLSTGEEDLPTYLPWPSIEQSVEGAPLLGEFISDFRRSQHFLMLNNLASTNRVSTNARHIGSIAECLYLLPGQVTGELPPSPESVAASNEFDRIECTDAGLAIMKTVLVPHLNFILYRQSRIVGGNEGDWVQVSPLIEFAHFDAITPVNLGLDPKDDPGIIKWRLNDPFIKFFYNTQIFAVDFFYLDRYPFVSSTNLFSTLDGIASLSEFRYQAVYFDSSHRPVRWRQSNWFKGYE